MKKRKKERRGMNYKIMGPGERERRSGKDQRSGFWGKSNDGNNRFWEYVEQIKLDGHDPSDVLETWLAKHNPEFFKGIGGAE
jgi:hypothetical protein